MSLVRLREKEVMSIRNTTTMPAGISALEGFVFISHRVRALLRLWVRRTSIEEVAHRGKCSRHLVERVLAGHAVPGFRAAGLLVLSTEELPPPIRIVCLGCNELFEAPDRTPRYCPTCKERVEEDRATRLRDKKRVQARARAAAKGRTPTEHTAPAVQVTPCPACQGPRRVKEGMAYCIQNRCDAGLQRWRKP
jgi:hypothetical protein